MKTTYYLIILMALAIINTTLDGIANLTVMILICLALFPAARRMDKANK